MNQGGYSRNFRADFWDGMVRIAPLVPAVAPFGLVCGATAANVGLGPEAGIAMSVIVYAGAAQLAILQLVADHALPVVMVMTALVINLRFAMYSASIAPHLRGAPIPARLLLAYVLTDQAYAVSLVRYLDGKDMAPRARIWFYAGGAIEIWVVWQVATVSGYFLGAAVPDGWSLDFAVPLTFGALLIAAVRSRADALAAAVGGSVAVGAAGLPYNLGLVLGAALGILAGVLFGPAVVGKRERGGEAG